MTISITKNTVTPRSKIASTAIAFADKLCVLAPINNADSKITAIIMP